MFGLYKGTASLRPCKIPVVGTKPIFTNHHTSARQHHKRQIHCRQDAPCCFFVYRFATAQSTFAQGKGSCIRLICRCDFAKSFSVFSSVSFSRYILSSSRSMNRYRFRYPAPLFPVCRRNFYRDSKGVRADRIPKRESTYC